MRISDWSSDVCSSELPATHANGGTISFAAPSRAAVHEFHKRALAGGGTDEGAPGPRSFSTTAYGAYIRDLDGNKICTFCYPARKSVVQGKSVSERLDFRGRSLVTTKNKQIQKQ